MYEVGRTGFEPVTSALSKQRSKPTELTTRERKDEASGGIFQFLSQIFYLEGGPISNGSGTREATLGRGGNTLRSQSGNNGIPTNR